MNKRTGVADSPTVDSSLGSHRTLEYSRYVFPAVAIAISVLFLIQSVGLGFGTLQTPGAGLWPFVISITTILLAVVQCFLPGASSDGADDSSRGSTKPHSRAVLLGALIFVYAVLVDYVGYLLLTAALLFIASLFVARAGWRGAVLTSLVSTGVVYMVFATLLGIPLPTWPAL